MTRPALPGPASRSYTDWAAHLYELAAAGEIADVPAYRVSTNPADRAFVVLMPDHYTQAQRCLVAGDVRRRIIADIERRARVDLPPFKDTAFGELRVPWPDDGRWHDEWAPGSTADPEPEWPHPFTGDGERCWHPTGGDAICGAGPDAPIHDTGAVLAQVEAVKTAKTTPPPDGVPAAMQTRCLSCLREHYILAVVAISRGDAACPGCGYRSEPMTDAQYRKKMRARMAQVDGV